MAKQTKTQGFYEAGTVRLTKSIKDSLKAIALERHTTKSEVIRQAILEQTNTRRDKLTKPQTPEKLAININNIAIGIDAGTKYISISQAQSSKPITIEFIGDIN